MPDYYYAKPSTIEGFLIVKKLRRRAIVKIVKCVRLSLRFL